MFLVMVGVDGEESAVAATQLLTARGFQTTKVPMNAVPQAIEATARGGERIDAVVLPAPLDIGRSADQSRAVVKQIRALNVLRFAVAFEQERSQS